MKKTMRIGKMIVSRILCFILCFVTVMGGFTPIVLAASGDNLNDFTSGVKLLYGGEDQITPPKTDIYDGRIYGVAIEFSEVVNGKQFADDGALTYQMPSSFVPAPNFVDKPQKITITVTNSNGTFSIPDNTYTIDSNGLVTFYWNQSDPNFAQLTNCANTTFKLDLQGSFDGSENNLDFGNGIKIDVDFISGGEPSIEKKGQYNSQTHQIDYELVVKSDGKSEGVTIRDVLSGTALSYDTDSFEITCSEPWSKNPFTPTFTADGFTYNIGTVKDGQVYSIKYSVDIDFEGITGKGTVDETKNNVSIKNDDDKSDEDTVDFKNQITVFQDIKKSVADKGYSGDKNIKEWTITVNDDPLASVGGKSVTDTLNKNGTDTIYSGSGITVKVYDKNGALVRTDTVPWSDLGTNPATDNTWSYTFPSSDTAAYSYVISYTTETDVSAMTTDKKISNKAVDDHSSKEVYEDVGPDDENKIGVKKEVIGRTGTEAEWKVTLDVPKKGLSTATLEEKYPYYYVVDGLYYDVLKPGSVNITGLLGDETYTLTPKGDGSGFDIVFYQNAGKTITGLKSNSTGLRQIVLTYKTVFAPKWVEVFPNGEHTNTVVFNGLSAQASTTPYRTEIVKASYDSSGNPSAKPVGYDTDGQPIYSYYLRLYGVTGEVVVEDTFDTSQLQWIDYSSANMFDLNVFGGNQYGQWESSNTTSGTNKAIITSTATGIKITVPEANLPRTATGELYEYYRVVYHLKAVKNQSVSAEAAGNADGIKKLTNTASFDGSSDSCDVDFKYPGVDKEVIKAQGGTDVIAQYTVTINPDAVTMNGGNSFEVVDEFTNLRVIYTSISITDRLGNDLVAQNKVTYDFTGNKGTFTVPDNQTVIIKYSAKVVGTGSVTYKNEVSTLVYKKETNSNGNFTSDSNGNASITNITIQKTQTGAMSKKLKGAKFELYKSSDPTNKLGTYVTGSDGTVKIAPGLNAGQGGFVLEKDVEYFLIEVEAPAGYKLSNERRYFTIASDDVADYENNIYPDGDIMNIYNTKSASFNVSKKKILGSDEINGAIFKIMNLSKTTTYCSWTSGTTPTEIEVVADGNDVLTDLKIAPGTYKLVEDVPPVGYKKADDIQFTVDADGKVTIEGAGSTTSLINMFDEPIGDVEISKVELVNGSVAGLSGASLALYEGKPATGSTIESFVSGKTPVHSWTSTTGTETVSGSKLKLDTYYTLIESDAPNGYEKALYITFKIDENGDVKELTNAYSTSNAAGREIVMLDTKSVDASFKIQKLIEGTTTKLGGSKFAIKDGDTTVLTFTSSAISDAVITIKSDGNTVKTDMILAPGSYKLVETEAPEGYKTMADLSFSVALDGTVTAASANLSGNATDGYVLKAYDSAIDDLKISKVELVNGSVAGLSGASLALYEGKPATGSTIESFVAGKTSVHSWTSTTGTETVSGSKLKLNTYYTLVENDAPNGYEKALYITFKIDENGEVKELTNAYSTSNAAGREIVMLDTKSVDASFKIQKLIEGTTTKLGGAKFAIKDGDTTVLTFTSSAISDAVITIKSDGNTVKTDMILAPGSYKLVETEAPEGYKTMADLSFSVALDGTVTAASANLSGNATDGYVLKAYDSAIDDLKISKVELVNGSVAGLSGASLALYEGKPATGSTIESFVSGKTPVHNWTSTTGTETVSGSKLKLNTYYTLVENDAPNGYEKALYITFKIDENGEVKELTNAHSTSDASNRKIVMLDEKSVDASFKIQKLIEGTTTKLGGAKFAIKDGDTTVLTFTSSAIADTVIVIKADGNTDKTDLILAPGSYKLVETEAPEGYKTMADLSFSVALDGTVTAASANLSGNATDGYVITVYNEEYTVIDLRIRKVDITGNNEKMIPGAKLELRKDSATGTLIDSWTTVANTEYLITGDKLKVNTTYVLIEKKAPSGYKKAPNITIVIDGEGNISTLTNAYSSSDKSAGLVVMKDELNKKKPRKPSSPDTPDTPDEDVPLDSPQTGDSNQILLYLILMIVSGGLSVAGINSLIRKRKED